jgi:hypothetical protein
MTRLLIFLMPALLFNCTPAEEVPEIVPTAFEPIEAGEFGVTVQQSAEYGTLQFERVKRNTLHHKIPDVTILGTQNSKKSLR